MDEGLRITVGNERFYERTDVLDDLQEEENYDDLRDQLRASARQSKHSTRILEPPPREKYYDQLYEDLLNEELLNETLKSVSPTFEYDDNIVRHEYDSSFRTSYRDEVMDLDSERVAERSITEERRYRRNQFDNDDFPIHSNYANDFKHNLTYEVGGRSRLRNLSPTEELSDRIRSQYGLSALRDECRDKPRGTLNAQDISKKRSFKSALTSQSGYRNLADLDIDDALIYERYATKPNSSQYFRKQKSPLLTGRLSLINEAQAVTKRSSLLPEESHLLHDDNFKRLSSSSFHTGRQDRSSAAAFDRSKSGFKNVALDNEVRMPRSQASASRISLSAGVSPLPGSSRSKRDFGPYSKSNFSSDISTFSNSSRPVRDTGTYSQSNAGKIEPAKRRRRSRCNGKAKFIYIKPNNPKLKALAEKYKYATGTEVPTKAVPSFDDVRNDRSRKLIEAAYKSDKMPHSDERIDQSNFRTQSLRSTQNTSPRASSSFGGSHKPSTSKDVNSSKKRTQISSNRIREMPNLANKKEHQTDQTTVKRDGDKFLYNTSDKQRKPQTARHTSSSQQNESGKQLLLDHTLKHQGNDINQSKDTGKKVLCETEDKQPKSNVEPEAKSSIEKESKKGLVGIAENEETGRPTRDKNSKADFADTKTDEKALQKDAENSSGLSPKKDASLEDLSKLNPCAHKNEASTRAESKIETQLEVSKSTTTTQQQANQNSKNEMEPKESIEPETTLTSKTASCHSVFKDDSISITEVSVTQENVNKCPLKNDDKVKESIKRVQKKQSRKETQPKVEIETKRSIDNLTKSSSIEEEKSKDHLDDGRQIEFARNKPFDILPSNIDATETRSKNSNHSLDVTESSTNNAEKLKTPTDTSPPSKEILASSDKTSKPQSIASQEETAAATITNKIEAEAKFSKESNDSINNKPALAVVIPQTIEEPMQISPTPYNQSIRPVIHQSALTKKSDAKRMYKSISSVVPKAIPPPVMFQSNNVNKTTAVPLPMPPISRPFSGSSNLQPVAWSASTNLKVIPTVNSFLVNDSKGSNPSNLVSIRVETEEERRAKRLDYLEREMEKLKKQQANMWMKKQKQNPANQMKASDGAVEPSQVHEEPTKVPKEAPKPPSKAPPSPKPIVYDYYDGGDHFCAICCRASDTLLEHICHLHTLEHTKMVDANHKPWLRALNPLPKVNADKSLPLGGMEFVLPVSGLYCELCDSTFPDASVAVVHCQTQEHNLKYTEFCKKNPEYQISRKNLVKQIQASCTIAKSLGLPLPNKRPPPEKELAAGRIKITLPTLPRYFEPQPYQAAAPAVVSKQSKRKRLAETSGSPEIRTEKRKKMDKRVNVSVTSSRAPPKAMETEPCCVDDDQEMALATTEKPSVSMPQRSDSADKRNDKLKVKIQNKQPANVTAKSAIKETSLISDSSTVTSVSPAKETKQKVRENTQKIPESIRTEYRIPGLSNSDDETAATDSNVEVSSVKSRFNEQSNNQIASSKSPLIEDTRASSSPKLVEKRTSFDPKLHSNLPSTKDSRVPACISPSTASFKPLELSSVASDKSRESRYADKSGSGSAKAVDPNSATVEINREKNVQKPTSRSSPSLTTAPKPKKAADNLFDFTTSLVTAAFADSNTYSNPSSPNYNSNPGRRKSGLLSSTNKSVESSPSSSPLAAPNKNTNEALVTRKLIPSSSLASSPQPMESSDKALVSKKSARSSPVVVSPLLKMSCDDKVSSESAQEASEDMVSESDNIFEKFTLAEGGSRKKETSKSKTMLNKLSTSLAKEKSKSAILESSASEEKALRSHSQTPVRDEVPQSISVPKAPFVVPKSTTSVAESLAGRPSPANPDQAETRRPFVQVSSASRPPPAVTEADPKPSALSSSVPINAILARRTAPTRSLRSNTKTFDSLPIARDPVEEKSPPEEKPRLTLQKARKSIRSSRNNHTATGISNKSFNSEPPPPGTEDDVPTD